MECEHVNYSAIVQKAFLVLDAAMIEVNDAGILIDLYLILKLVNTSG